MNYMAAKHVQSIRECFSRWGNILRQPNEAQWDLVFRNGSALSVQANLVEDWLQIHADPGAAAGSTRIWEGLKWNSGLDGAAKFVLDFPARSLGIQAEIPLCEEVNIMPGLNATLSGFERAASLFHDPSSRATDAETKSPGERAAQDSTLPLQQLLTEADWPVTERSEGSCAVELDSKNDFHQALIKTEQDGSRWASVELATWENPTPVSLKALSVLLMTASGVIRMARPAAEDRGDRITARFEIRFSPDASPALLDRGLSSLSVACRLCGREAALLNNRRIAEEYLAVRQFTIE